MRILITGGSGMLGRAITAKLLQKGHEVAWLSRGNKTQSVPVFIWNPAKGGLDAAALEWADAVINLAGKSIGELPWNSEGKKQILSSRIDAVQTLAEALRHQKKTLQAFVGVSGVGIYGQGEAPFYEEDRAGEGFPAFVASQWEEAYRKISPELSNRRCILRLAVVLSSQGGALPKMLLPIKFGIGAAIGSGRQWLNWIHLDDAAEAFCQALEWEGTINLASPQPVRNMEATRLMAKIWKRPLWLPPVPEFILGLGLGERAQLVTQGNRTDVSKLLSLGFRFRFPSLEEALQHIKDQQV